MVIGLLYLLIRGDRLAREASHERVLDLWVQRAVLQRKCVVRIYALQEAAQLVPAAAAVHAERLPRVGVQSLR